MMKQMLHVKVYSFTEEKSLFHAPCRVLIGLSGGADSMSLLHCLLGWPQKGLSLHAVHIHHGLRGEEADRDEAFVREQCTALNVPLTVVRADVATEAAAANETLEQAGRRVRYREFQRLAEEIGADVIATAHTADDQTETVLLHLLRGSGVDGLAGIPARRGCVVRPLLDCTRSEVEAFCAQQQIPYITDSTNTDVTYTRNRVRHELLPFLRQFNPAADEAIRRMAAHAAEDSTYLQTLSTEALEASKTACGYRTAVFVERPQAVRRRMLRELLTRGNCFDVAQPHLLAMEQAILRGKGRVSLPGGGQVVVSQGLVHIENNVSAVSFPEEVRISPHNLPQTIQFGDGRFRLSVIKPQETEDLKNVHKLFFKFVIDYDKIQGDLFVRVRREGDRIHPAGRKVGKTVKKLMNELKIPVSKRECIPLLCDSEGVLLLPGYCCDERAVHEASTKHFLVWEPLDE
ncbi:MAG: tRNA lysidine(34) synthetase TilS [Clostridia bacterium]|nr:tRNA lysidine(34) synthetase TilS [Clostridia bacterium]